MRTICGPRSVRRNRPLPRGFTLIEILVVVAIIALLISILLPSLRAARSEANTTVCGTHLTQIFTGMFMYTQANREVLPHLGYRSDTNRIVWLWFTQIAPLIKNQYGVYTCPGDRAPEKHTVYPGEAKLRLARTTEPSTTLPVTYRGSCDSLDDSRAWVIGGPGLSPVRVAPMPRPITDFKRPAMSILLVEGWPPTQSGEECFRFDQLSHMLERTKKPYPGQAEAVASFSRHMGSSNFLFADSHVGRHTVQQAYDKLPYQQQFSNPDLMRKK